MKKTLIILLGGIAFATLFYSQSLGINALIYSIFLIITLAIIRKRLLLKSTTILSGVAMLSSAVAICWHGSHWSIFCYFASSLIFVGYLASYQSSIYMSWLNGIYNTVFGVFHSFIYQEESDAPASLGTKKKIDIGQLIKVVFIPLILIIVFTLLYSSSNPVFSELLAEIDFTFIDMSWLFTAAIGGLIMANLASASAIKDLTQNDLNQPNQLQPNVLTIHQIKSTHNESQIGFISILSLNILLVLVLVTEALFLIDLTDSRASVLSEAVHQGVYASIVSIVLAIAVIAFIFRGEVNFIKNNRNLKKLTYLWIALNALLVASIFVKNYLYIHEHGLTHKRIGVLVYLLLTIFGLVTTYLKVSHRLNFVYLLRRNMAIGYAVISIYAVINWSAIITDHNISINQIDQSYLESLQPQNVLVLKTYGLYEEYQKKNTKYGYSSDRYFEKDFINRNWQEFNWIAHQIQLDNEKNAPTTASSK